MHIDVWQILDLRRAPEPPLQVDAGTSISEIGTLLAERDGAAPAPAYVSDCETYYLNLARGPRAGTRIYFRVLAPVAGSGVG